MASKISVTNADEINNNITIVQFNTVTQLSIKLTCSHNFSLWKTQVSMLMHGHNLYGHLDGSITTPTRTISQNNQDVDNLEFIPCLRDRLARVTKDSRPVTDYLHQVRSLCDELATARALRKRQAQLLVARETIITPASRPGVNLPANNKQWQAQRPRRKNQQ
ncbi:uncharacterized protein LOC107869101 [Capsicum annuum]|uniref:uncharacterized protein LOC107869101 n=1 Tax=Capsicum annuum TaxID=4072 RepID=UPI0007BF38FE|nr:uncharacterized protein LOC107869101 [Capsicum annuum]